MLDGITVLETISEPKISPDSAAWVAILGTITLIIFVVNCIQCIKKESYEGIFMDEAIGKIFAFVFDTLIVVAIVAGCAHIWTQQNTILVKHRVIIDESVSLVAFNEKYEIIQRDGDEYIIKELKKAD